MFTSVKSTATHRRRIPNLLGGAAVWTATFGDWEKFQWAQKYRHLGTVYLG